MDIVRRKAMLFISVEDFYDKAKNEQRLTREQEKSLYLKMRAGDGEARVLLLKSYLPFIASFIKRSPESIRTLDTVYRCIAALERCADGFDFSQDSESFVHRLSFYLRSCIVGAIADKN